MARCTLLALPAAVGKLARRARSALKLVAVAHGPNRTFPLSRQRIGAEPSSVACPALGPRLTDLVVVQALPRRRKLAPLLS